MPSSADFYTVKEVARILRISTNTAYIYARKKKGGPPVRRFGRNIIRFPKDEFDAWAGLAKKGI